MKKYIDLKEYGKNQSLRKRYFESSSIQHPAKMDLPLCRWIIDKFCHKNAAEVILDPMAGIGSTLIMGILMRPNSIFIGVELEDKFVKMAQANIKKVEQIAKKDMFMKIGRAVVFQGDARELEKILEEKVSKIITSPPYAETKKGKSSEKQARRMAKEMEKANPKYGKRTTPGRLKHLQKEAGGYSENPENIGNLPYANKIISSPPFGQAQSGGGIAKKGYDGPKHGPTDLVGKRSYTPENIGGKENIGNLPYGQTDKIITSPPFGGQVQHKTNYLGKQKKESGFEYSDNPENIGNMPHGKISKIVSSPPFERTISSKSGGPISEKFNAGGCRKLRSYSDNKDNIGNLANKTYLGEILRVYKQCYKVLKPAGLMILITKDFIRGGKRIHLGEDTVKLCQAAGFEFLKTYHRKIERPSFWRTLQVQKYGEAYRIDCEDILIFKKKRPTRI